VKVEILTAASGAAAVLGNAVEDGPGWWKVIESGGMLAVLVILLYYFRELRKEDTRRDAERENAAGERDRLFLAHNRQIVDKVVADLSEVAEGQMGLIQKVIEVLTETKNESQQNTKATAELRQAIQQMSLELARKADKQLEGAPPGPKAGT
jgi:hypothetical protein